MFCPNCGTELEGAPAFCENCGAKVGQNVSAQQTQPQPASEAQPTSGYDFGQNTHQSGGYANQETPQMGGQPNGQAAQPTTRYSSGYSQAPGAGYAPAPGAGYAPAPGPGQQMPGKQGSNAPFVLAIIALVTAILGLFPISIILAIIALVMNSGQKKRGEASTKQTPTFVMGLISLILSIIMAIATIVLGGAIWLAILEDDDLDDVLKITEPSSTSSSQSNSTATNASLVGTWQAKSAMLDGVEYDEDYLALAQSYGGSIELLCYGDNTVTFDFGILEEAGSGTWQLGDSGKVVLTLDGEKLEGTLSGDELTLANDEDSIIFKHTSTAEPAASSASNDSSASTASATSSSSSSASASSDSEARALSTQDVGRPSESDFAWVSSASGSLPKGAIQLTNGADVSGTWKAMLEYHDYDGSTQGKGLDNLKIQAGDRAVTITFDWYKINFGDGWEDVKDNDVSMDGAIDSGEITASSSYGNVDLELFYEAGGSQYGIGSMVLPSGETATISLVRP